GGGAGGGPGRPPPPPPGGPRGPAGAPRGPPPAPTTPGARPPVAAELIDKLAAGTPIPYEAVFLAEPTATEADAATAREWMRGATAQQPKTEARSEGVRIGARTVAAIERIADRIEEHDDERNCSLEDLCVELAEAWHGDPERRDQARRSNRRVADRPVEALLGTGRPIPTQPAETA
ncbi:MAG: hypothetical protein OXQ28_13970, partial [Acidobacteriota bacterium]|nr:hypothetical protein [Acidobacteriota bacterium]